MKFRYFDFMKQRITDYFDVLMGLCKTLGKILQHPRASIYLD